MEVDKIQAKEITLVNIEEIKENPKNANRHSIEQIERLEKLIQYQKFRNPLVVSNRTGLLIAGHGRLCAAKNLGMEQVPVIYQDFESEAQEYAYLISDNEIARWAELDKHSVYTELESLELEDIELLGIEDFELPQIEMFPEENENAIPEVENIITKKGDVWLLGEHRLLCGDSTFLEDVKNLMQGQKADLVFTDPPYGVSAGGGRSQTVEKLNIQKIENDDLRGDNLRQFLVDALSLIPLKNNASFYVCYDQKTQYEFTGALKDINWNQRNTIIWNKNVFGLSGKKGYRPKFEMIAFGYFGETYNWFGGNDKADVWDIKRPNERPGNHPTPKPVELIELALENSSEKGQIVIDLFCGSGSTLIAAEKTKRKCYAIELSEKYCDVIINRWQDLTGQEAILESSRETYNSMVE